MTQPQGSRSRSPTRSRPHQPGQPEPQHSVGASGICGLVPQNGKKAHCAMVAVVDGPPQHGLGLGGKPGLLQ